MILERLLRVRTILYTLSSILKSNVTRQKPLPRFTTLSLVLNLLLFVRAHRIPSNIALLPTPFDMYGLPLCAPIRRAASNLVKSNSDLTWDMKFSNTNFNGIIRYSYYQ